MLTKSMKKIPNKTTLEVFAETDQEINITEVNSISDLFRENSIEESTTIPCLKCGLKDSAVGCHHLLVNHLTGDESCALGQAYSCNKCERMYCANCYKSVEQNK